MQNEHERQKPKLKNHTFYPEEGGDKMVSPSFNLTLGAWITQSIRCNMFMTGTT